MASSELAQVLSDSATEVLESMFFTTVMDDSEACRDSSLPWISARLAFHGNPPGIFGVRTPPETGRKIAASFLGLEEDALTKSQVGEVVCELANMLCGSVLSRLEPESRFELSGPEIDAAEAACPENATVCRAFELEEGPLAVWLQWERAG